MYGKDRDGTGRPALVDPEGAIVQASGCYTEAAIEGRLFSIANQAAVATTAALATTWTGLGVCNPAGSGKNLIIHEFGWALTVVGSDEGGVGLMIADDTGMAAALTARAAKYGAGASVAYCDDGATIGTPVLERIYGTYGTVQLLRQCYTRLPFIISMEVLCFRLTGQC